MFEEMIQIYLRVKERIRIMRGVASELNRRVEIENKLLSIASGKSPIPTRDECRVLALKLGTPKKFWPEEWR